MVENPYARRLNRFNKELIDALAQADDVLNFDAAKTAKLFREWRATLSGVPAAESLLNFWARAPSEWTANGTDFRKALGQLSDTLRGCADRFDPKRHAFRYAIERIWSLDAQENGESTSIQSIQKLRDVERNVKLLLNHNNEGDELDRLIRPAVDDVLATIADILNDRDFQRIDGAAQLLSSIDESEFRRILEEPMFAAGHCTLLTSVLVNLHDTCAVLEPIELSVKERNDVQRAVRSTSEPASNAKKQCDPMPPLWDEGRELRTETESQERTITERPVDSVNQNGPQSNNTDANNLSPADSSRRTVDVSESNQETKRREWNFSPADSFPHGPIEAQIKELAEWLGQTPATLNKSNGKSFYGIRKVHRTQYECWFTTSKKYAEINRRVLETRPSHVTKTNQR